MPIDLDAWNKIEERNLKGNKDLLLWMSEDQAYTTTEVQNFLGIHHPAALQRLKRLEQLNFVEFKVLGKTKYWRKLHDWPEEETVELDYTNPLDPVLQRQYAQDMKNDKSERERNKRNSKKIKA